MSKRLILILALALLVGISSAAYAEVQNVKVSGDIATTGSARNNFDLAKEPVAGSVPVTTAYSDKTQDIFSITRLRVDADLTDNVGTTVRLLNERNWNGETSAVGSTNRNIGAPTSNNLAANENDIDLDLAFITLKEFLYSPLTLRVGRQELALGNKLIIGDPDTNIYSVATGLAEGDLSSRKAFDAIRATLDYNPLVVDLVYAKAQEGMTNLNDDVSVTGINASYELDKATTVEGFFFAKQKGTQAASTWNIDFGSAGVTTTAWNPITGNQGDSVYTIGGRVVNSSINNLGLDAQLAYQFGKYNPRFDPNARWVFATFGGHADVSDRSALAIQASATYDLKDISAVSKYSPVVTGSYTYLSGEDRFKTGNRAYKGWDPMFEDQTCGHLINAIFSNTNKHQAALSTKAKLTDDVNATLDYTTLWFATRQTSGTGGSGANTVLSGVATTAAAGTSYRIGKTSYIGQEVDLTLTYDYTEDVQFSLLGGIFMPGKAINETAGDDANPQRVAATELLGSMKVTF